MKVAVWRVGSDRSKSQEQWYVGELAGTPIDGKLQ
jgi:hypothetical protein